MKLKKHIGVLLLMLVTIVSTGGRASAAGIGLEEMPDSLKKLR